MENGKLYPLEGVDEEKVNCFAATEHSPWSAGLWHQVRRNGYDVCPLRKDPSSTVRPITAPFVERPQYAHADSTLRFNRKLVRVVNENKVDALKNYKLGTPELMQIKTRQVCHGSFDD
jgi:hypothetical protein